MFRFLTILPLLLTSSVASAAAPGKVRFNRDIRPVMSDTCFHCHGPDKNSRKAGLRLDLREAALLPAKSGEIPIVPGKPDDSAVIRRLFTGDADDLMPPAEAHKTLTSDQKALFRRWVAEGAEYEPHWAYTPLVRPPLPAVRGAVSPDKAAAAIDSFVLERLEPLGLDMSDQADRRTLLRRVSLDLTGLPPAPADTAAFLADTRPGAWERQVDRLLASPHFGERMAVWWLDVARYADTVGFHGDQNQHIYPYRDYVISAFNRNLPFDRFTREQLAGDLLPNPTPEQLVATGFNRLNMMTREGGAQPGEYLAKYGAERVRTVSGAWLGATMGCCECHDHKFDPFSARDFYSLQAFFADVRQWGVYNDYGYTPNPDLRGFTNDYPFPPEIAVENAGLKLRARELRARMMRTVLEAPLDAAAFTAWKAEATAWFAAHPDGWQSLALTTPEPAAPDKTPAPPKAGTPVTLTFDAPAGRIAALRLDLRADPALRGSQKVLRISPVFAIVSADGKSEPIAIWFADAASQNTQYASGEPIANLRGGWRTDGKAAGEPTDSVWAPGRPLTLAAGERLTVTLPAEAAGKAGLSVAAVAPLLPLWRGGFTPVREALARGDDSLLREPCFLSSAADDSLRRDYQKTHAALADTRDGRTWSLVTEAVADPLTVRVLPRGNWMDQSGPVTPPAVPAFLPAAFRPDSGHRATRLDLANWLCAPENPLTGRAVMNRLWKEFFGTGLSAIVDDLGAQGEPPSHPELLDWLAVEFRESGWDVKHMVRTLVLSRVYRQDSRRRPALEERDPANRLLASQNPRRLAAEFVRDNALAVSGLLNPDAGGPPSFPWQPEGYYAALQFPDRQYIPDMDGWQWRRGVYMHWQRTFLHPMLANFDAPQRDECTANRNLSNTPQQALTLLNDPVFVEAARSLADRTLHSAGTTDAARLSWAWQRCLNRLPTERERTPLLALLQSQRALYTAQPGEAAKLLHIGEAPVPVEIPAPELAAWTAVCRVLLNLHETITRY